jgi:hypothetical protein
VEREAYLLELARDVVLNPVRAGIAREAGAWAWSSYRAMLGQASAPGWLETDWLLGQFGAERAGAQAGYEDFVRHGLAVQASGKVCVIRSFSAARALSSAVAPRPRLWNGCARSRVCSAGPWRNRSPASRAATRTQYSRLGTDRHIVKTRRMPRRQRQRAGPFGPIIA